ncbi:hypothetical protein [Mycobacterium szulgai]|uniref:Uncharacterized protein n=1 Tax=Mycobacterium szulgai TaxID=1787 RepID=A0A1X2FJQ7_MYCSZ|nr:hypothetical protein [Mycobacterium szulgai]MCV7075356.1 hypothetical protein [Mycobacterium szulgai]ORX18199.1 hypothetical protein AWC27_17605 [Mycobacterium szulgai]
MPRGAVGAVAPVVACVAADDGAAAVDDLQALSLSVAHVEGDIYRASCKAGIATRAELANVVAQFDR